MFHKPIVIRSYQELENLLGARAPKRWKDGQYHLPMVFSCNCPVCLPYGKRKREQKKLFAHDKRKNQL